MSVQWQINAYIYLLWLKLVSVANLEKLKIKQIFSQQNPAMSSDLERKERPCRITCIANLRWLKSDNICWFVTSENYHAEDQKTKSHRGGEEDSGLCLRNPPKGHGDVIKTSRTAFTTRGPTEKYSLDSHFRPKTIPLRRMNWNDFEGVVILALDSQVPWPPNLIILIALSMVE